MAPSTKHRKAPVGKKTASKATAPTLSLKQQKTLATSVKSSRHKTTVIDEDDEDSSHVGSVLDSHGDAIMELNDGNQDCSMEIDDDDDDEKRLGSCPEPIHNNDELRKQ